MGVKKRGSFKLPRTIAQFKRKKSTLPRKVGEIAKNHFLDNFRKGGFVDRTLERWERLKDGTESRLTRSGKLKRSIRVKSARFARIVIGTTGVVYAAIHNFGLKGLAFGRSAFNMPKRQFIGNSRLMDRKIIREIDNEVKRIF